MAALAAAAPPLGEVTARKTSKNATEYTFTMKSTATTNSQGYKGSMQERFAQFRKKKLAEARMRKYVARRGKRTPAAKAALRRKFLRQVESYLGVPYAQKYHPEGTPDHDAPLFLDCCALVRRAVNDLQEDFGFRLGRWNQNYQFSTLSSGSPAGRCERADAPQAPDARAHVCPTSDPAAKTFEELVPGDLIFWEATYFSDKARKQRLSLVHVEVFTGKGPQGEGTIGARWQKGHVQHFDTFRFESKSYHSIKYHFRSVDRWLDGVCKCAPAHKGWWVDSTSTMAVNKYSMFNADARTDDDFCDEGAGDVDDDGAVAAPVARRKAFYVGKSNGWKMVRDALGDRGWVQIPFDESFSTKFDFRWVERRSQIDWLAHRAGEDEQDDATAAAAAGGEEEKTAEAVAATNTTAARRRRGIRQANKGPRQLVNHIANNNVITVKTGLLNVLRDVEDDAVRAAARFPETYDLSIASDRLKFLAATRPPPTPEDEDDYVDSDDEVAVAEHAAAMWIVKPAAMNRGRGIKVLRDVGPLRRELLGGADVDGDGSDSMGIDTWRGGNKCDALAQRYIARPLLVRGTRKFDVRAYCLVSRCDAGNLRAFFHEGYARVGLVDYDCDDSKLGDDLVHLTNIAVQRRHPDYETLKNDAVLSMAGLQAAVDAPDGWALGAFTDQMKASMAAVITAAAARLDRRSGCFDLLGFDFMADADGKDAHLIEVNTNPALHVSDGKVLADLLPGLVAGTVDICLEEHGLEEPHPSASAARANFELILDEQEGFRFNA